MTNPLFVVIIDTNPAGVTGIRVEAVRQGDVTERFSQEFNVPTGTTFNPLRLNAATFFRSLPAGRYDVFVTEIGPEGTFGPTQLASQPAVIALAPDGAESITLE